MFESLKNPIYMSIIIYSFIVIFVLKKKPSMFFKKNSEMKSTGCGKNKTIFSFPMFIVLSSILTYFIVKYLQK